MSTPDAGQSDLLELVFGYQPAQLVHVAARLGIADQLASGPMTPAELATATGTHAPSLHRLLRGLVCVGALAHAGPAGFELTQAGRRLRADAPDSIRAQVMLYCAEKTWRSWGELEYGVRTGEVAAEYVTGMTTFEYFAKHPEKSAVFNAAMAGTTRAAAPAILAGYDFSRFGTLVDVGGGDGTLISAVLTAVPGMRGVLFDSPTGVERAAVTLDGAGVADRCEVATGDFFDSVPEGADAYLLKSVIHDWDDEKSVTILRNCRHAMAEGGTVLVVEPVLPQEVSPADTSAVLSDLNMMLNTGGRERTEEEFGALYAAAGLELTEVVGPVDRYRIVVGRAPSAE